VRWGFGIGRRKEGRGKGKEELWWKGGGKRGVLCGYYGWGEVGKEGG